MKIKYCVLLYSALTISTLIGMEKQFLRLQGIENDRKSLMNALDNCDYYTAKMICNNNPSVLPTQKDDVALDMMFARRCIAISPLLVNYKTDFKELMDCGFNLDICYESGKPLLCSVIERNDGNKYLDLLEAGARVNMQDSYGNNALSYAAYLCKDDIVSKLLLYGAVVKRGFCKNLANRHPLKRLMVVKYSEQKCSVCDTHDQDDNALSNIPCINRHFGIKFGQEIANFMCKRCYDQMSYKKQCPICSRSLGEFSL